MPAPEQVDRDQKAVLWPAQGYDNYGRPTVGPPTQVAVRWLTKRSRVLDRQGNSISLDASAVVGQRILVGSRMWLGSLEDWLGIGSGCSDDELMEVKTYGETPDIKNRFTQKTVGLMRLHSKG